jgi:ATP-dependent 26S proteasome regulatory subunit
MNQTPPLSWPEANQQYLMAELSAVRQILDRYEAQVTGGHNAPDEPQLHRQEAIQPIRPAMPAPAALDQLCTTFNLTPFERAILLLCAGMELDSVWGAKCAAAQGDARRAHPTFSLALSALPDAHWSALSPSAPLRRWRLIELGAGQTLLTTPLRIDERILHYLAGVSHLDERLGGLVDEVPAGATDDLPPSHRALANRMAGIWLEAGHTQQYPVVQLCGHDVGAKRLIAAAACDVLRRQAHRMSAHLIPLLPNELDAVQRLWLREAALTGSVLVIESDEMESTDAARDRIVTRLIESISGPVVVISRERRHTGSRPVISFDVAAPAASERRTIWTKALERARTNLNGRMETLVAQFSVSVRTIQAACMEAQAQRDTDRSGEVDAVEFMSRLWDACRRQARSRLDDLAQYIEPTASWDDLVLPELQRRQLRDMAAHVRQRGRVYEEWGFAAKGPRGLGITALFAGASGTGKTLAAEVLAGELRLDLYRIDLSQVVSKYIGETEKNLRRVFDAAEEGGAILLFDEADALFGKRSEVKDSHDRYANIEVSYLLQRMEAYRGMAILTTNMKSALDQAFLRRIRFIVQFPFPDPEQRAEIWRQAFPRTAPTEGLDEGKLARLNVAGGNIRNIAMNAAFLAAEAGEPIHMRHVLHAVRCEYAKLEKPLTETEIAGWA